MKDYPIEKFGTKLMVASKSVNNIPDFYLSLSRNARIYDGGIGPRRGKTLLKSSTLGTRNRGGFTLGGKLYQVTNSKIYETSLVDGTQTEKATVGYDAQCDVLTYGSNIAIIVSSGQAPKVYDGATTVTTPATVPASNTGIIEYCRGFSFLAGGTGGNILYVSRPITAANPEYAYDWTGSGSQNITYDKPIKALKATLNGLYVFTEDLVDFLGANALQNVAGSATLISTPIGAAAYPVNNLNVAAAGDKIFWVSKNLQVMTVNYVPGIASTQIGELSARPVVSIKEFLDTLSTDQATSFGFFNENDQTVQFHLRSASSGFNDEALVYDTVNDTWNVDTGKNYNNVVKIGFAYYGLSDVNSSVYQDDVGFSDNGVAIGFHITSQYLIQGTYRQKTYRGLFAMGGIGSYTSLNVIMGVDSDTVFSDIISGFPDLSIGLGDVGGAPVGGEPIGGFLGYTSTRSPFDLLADEGRVFNSGTRCQIDISSSSLIQDFIIDRLGVRADVNNFVDTQNKW